MRKLTIIAAMLLLAPGFIQAQSLEELLVEKGVITRGEMRAAAHSGAAKTYWNDGTRLDFADQGFTVRFNTLLQTRYEFEDGDSDVAEENVSSFSVRRARLIMSGTALHEEFNYRVEYDFVGNEGEDGAREPELLDGYIQWNACDWGAVRLGQFRTAISRQGSTDAASLQFPERSEVSNTFATDRQVGARAILFDDDNDRWELTAAIYNGESDDEGGIGGGRNHSGTDTNHMGDVSARLNIMGQMDHLEEGDVNKTEDLALNIGAAYSFSQGNNNLSSFGLTPLTQEENTDVQRFSGDVNLKHKGFSFHGEFFWANIENDAVADDTDPVGGYAQVGAFLTDNVELAVRYGYVDCDEGTVTGACLIEVGNGGIPGVVDDLNEAAASINYYWWKHHLKAQFAWMFLDRDLVTRAGDVVGESDVQDNTWILQLSAYF